MLYFFLTIHKIKEMKKIVHIPILLFMVFLSAFLPSGVDPATDFLKSLDFDLLVSGKKVRWFENHPT